MTMGSRSSSRPSPARALAGASGLGGGQRGLAGGQRGLAGGLRGLAGGQRGFSGGHSLRRPFTSAASHIRGIGCAPLCRRLRQYDSRVSGIDPGQGPAGDATVLVERRWQASIVFAFIGVACAVALLRGVTGPQSAGGRAAVGVLFGAILVLIIVGAIRWGRSPRRRLEITADAIRYVPPNGRVSALSRESGDELRFVLRHRGPMSRVWVLGLNIKGTDTIMDVQGEFPRDPIRQACVARGWRFDEQRRNWRGMPRLSRPSATAVP
jgi:hypothetical protein